MKRQTFPTKIYWEEIPEEKNQLKDILVHGEYQKPAKVLNSKEVTAETKPWLLKKTVKSDEKINLTEKQRTKPKIQQRINIGKTKQAKEVTLKDLRQEDKQKVANLIRELAKSGNEKEKALETLNSIKKNYGAKIKQLQVEKEQAIKKHDSLKEKLLEYEILVENIQQKDISGNITSLNKGKMSEKSDVDDDSKTDSVADNFSELFMEQQQKFYKQQEVLQEQIEHLQKLQESILKQQSKEFQELQEKSTEENASRNTYTITKDPKLGTSCSNTQKLECYIQSENSFCHPIEDQHFFKGNVSKRTSETPLNKKDLSSIKAQRKTKEDTKSTNDKSIDTVHNRGNPTIPKSMVDMCIQTESTEQTSKVNKRLLNCEKHISKFQESLLSLSQSYSDTPTIPFTSNEKKNKSFGEKYGRPNHSKTHLSQQGSSSEISNIKTLSTTTFPCDSNSDSGNDEVHFPINPSSAVKRRNFQPSSILDLVEGIQPHSTSTSVDQHSLQRKQVVTNVPSKLKMRAIKAEKSKGKFQAKESFEEDDEERNMLDAIFFL